METSRFVGLLVSPQVFIPWSNRFSVWRHHRDGNQQTTAGSGPRSPWIVEGRGRRCNPTGPALLPTRRRLARSAETINGPIHAVPLPADTARPHHRTHHRTWRPSGKLPFSQSRTSHYEGAYVSPVSTGRRAFSSAFPENPTVDGFVTVASLNLSTSCGPESFPQRIACGGSC